MRLRETLRTLLDIIRHVQNWPLYFMHRLKLMGERPIVYRLRNGVKVASRPFHTDRGVLNDVWFEQMYEPNANGVPYSWDKARTIIDIGGSVGAFSLYAAKMAPQATVYTYEPEPGNFEQIRMNVGLNHLEDRIVVHEQAVGASKGEMTLHVSHRSSGDHSMYQHEGESHPITVSVVSLGSIFDTYNIQQCDFLKIDCEGAEYEILYTLPPEYFRRIKFIALERHLFSDDETHNGEALQKFLEKKKFSVTPYKRCMMFAVRAN